MSTLANPLVAQRIGRNLPNPMIDGTPNQPGNTRGGRYGEGYVLSLVPTKHVLADEGSYYTGCMTPSQTALAYGVQATFSDTAGFILIANTDTPGGRRIYLDYLKMNLSVAPASATAAWLAAKIDSANRAPTANSSKISPQGVNMDVPANSVCGLYFPTGGTLTLPAAGGNARLVVGNLALRGVLPTVGDEYVVSFGTVDYTQSENAAVATATVVKRQIAAPPLVIGGGQYAAIHVWFPSNVTTAASFSNIEVGWWER